MAVFLTTQCKGRVFLTGLCNVQVIACSYASSAPALSAIDEFRAIDEYDENMASASRDAWTVHDGQAFATAFCKGKGRCPQDRLKLRMENN
mgnify:CR=1 FL=1